MSTTSTIEFWIIGDPDRDLFILLNEAHRYGTRAAAIAHRKPGESLWRCTGAAIPDDQVTENS